MIGQKLSKTVGRGIKAKPQRKVRMGKKSVINPAKEEIMAKGMAIRMAASAKADRFFCAALFHLASWLFCSKS
jgi:hypothetical protein